MNDIFISYKREEQAEARKLADALEQEGWSVWWDLKLRAGQDFDDVIEEVLQKAKCVIVLWSKESVKSRYVKAEAAYALEHNKLVPVAIEEVKLSFLFARIHTPQLIGWNGSANVPEYRRLVEDITAIAGTPSVTKPAPSEKRKQGTSPKPIPQELPAQKQEKVLEPGAVLRDTLQDGSQGPEMVVIPAGQFEMGDIWGDGYEDEKPAHAVHIHNPFALGRYPVTFDQYDLFAKNTGRDLTEDQGWGRGQRPVINVSWEDSVAYAEWLSQQTGKRYRLPSEAEWEYAARSGGKEEKWAGTSVEKNLGDYAWYWENSGEKTHPVGEKKPNGLGLYDMSGNVWEWVQDWWNEGYVGVPDDGSAWTSGDGGLRVIRGGAWHYGPGSVRSADRFGSTPGLRYGSVGFRLAQDL